MWYTPLAPEQATHLNPLPSPVPLLSCKSVLSKSSPGSRIIDPEESGGSGGGARGLGVTKSPQSGGAYGLLECCAMIVV